MSGMPAPRGAITEVLAEELAREVHELPSIEWATSTDALNDEDLQLALYLCYELHYRGMPGVDERWEWEPSLLGLRRRLEQQFERALLDAVPYPPARVQAAQIDLALRAIADQEGPSLSSFIRSRATVGQVHEFMVHRSAYQLKEADPHSWAIPRLAGSPKAALIEIQADEYGGGRPALMHAELFRSTMRWLGLDDAYGSYVPDVPGVTLANSNVMSLFALHRRWLGALLGHLAALEMTSTGPNRRYAAGARRLGAGERARRYFDEHVEADAVHEQIAAHDLCGGYAARHPAAVGDILFGASCCLALDAALGRHLLACWQAGRTSLRPAPRQQPAA